MIRALDPRRAALAVAAAAALAAAAFAWGAASAQPADAPDGGEAAQAAAEEADSARAEAEASLRTIRSLLALVAEKEAEAEDIRARIEAAETEVDETAASEELTAANAEIARLRAQIEALASGVDIAALDAAGAAFDLQSELEDLIQPFILMLKSATENARAIERLRRTIRLAEQRADTAADALDNLDRLLAEVQSDGPIGSLLLASYENWRERRDQARDEAAAAQRQLDTRLAARVDPAASTGAAFQSFFSERGRNLAFGVGALALVVFTLRLLRRGALALIGAPLNRAAPVRIGAFVFDVVSMTAGVMAMLAVFNASNDWLLTGLTILILLGVGWYVLGNAPSLIEQITLLLNLGAVQEGERLMLEGVPWRVSKLDFYTDLENPALSGGHFTLPIRELRGLHSRPAADDEVWFPSETGDVVALASGLWGQVAFQSPELVQIRDEGGALTTFTVAGYLEQSPRNLSQGYRVEITIGLDYAHQSEATESIPRALETYLKPRIEDLFGVEAVRKLESDLVGLGDSALEIEVAVWMDGAAALRVEDVRDALTRLSTRCCTDNGWNIPFQTLTLRQA